MAETKVKSAEQVPEIEETVMIKIPRERNDQEDVVVWVNDRRFLIKRGVNVEVPVSVAFILEQQEKAMETIYEYENKVQR